MAIHRELPKMPKTKAMKGKRNNYNLLNGWSLAKVQRIIAHYENQTDEEAAAEDEAIFARPSETVM
ncbi:MAG: hypothetical protein ACRD5G_02445 [Candidatus Acidiferrales bacterium]